MSGNNRALRAPRADQTYNLYDVRFQIRNLKSQYLYGAIFNKSRFNDETYLKAIHSLCNRVAKFYKVNYRPAVLGKPNADEINLLITNLYTKLGIEASTETETNMVASDDIHVSEISAMIAEAEETPTETTETGESHDEENV